MDRFRKLRPLMRAFMNDLVIIVLAMGVLFLILVILAEVRPH